jgi:hypothetical protein
LPLLEGAEVFLLGSGLPSFWVARMGDMRLTLGLSGWTANDWTGATALDQLAPPGDPSDELLADIAATFTQRPAQTFEQIQQQTGVEAPSVAAGLNRLALLGQLIHDLPAGVYRWRQIMPVALSLQEVGPDNPETEAARQLVARKALHLVRDERRPDGLRLLEGLVAPAYWGWTERTLARLQNPREGEPAGRPVELLLDADGRMLRGKCNCSHHYKSGLRRGPCRHLQALRTVALGTGQEQNLGGWFERLWGEIVYWHVGD